MYCRSATLNGSMYIVVLVVSTLLFCLAAAENESQEPATNAQLENGPRQEHIYAWLFGPVYSTGSAAVDARVLGRALDEVVGFTAVSPWDQKADLR